ncbi:MAG: TrkH family potassium uptake protein [Clostridiales bacterium]|jgi:trk system potassium uptake protein TrkH|nr:TrkH family potassium uptake protein [Clostridiales bacterium]
MKKEKIEALKKIAEKVFAALRGAANKISRGNVYGKLFILIGALISVPAAASLFLRGEIKYAPAFLIPAVIAAAIGVAAGILFKQKNENARFWQSPIQQGSLPVLSAWLFAIGIGSLPFVIGGQMRPLDSLFESVSGWTTTGLTLADVENMPKTFLFYRSFMQYCGGLGFILMVNMLVHGKSEINLFNAEGHPDRIMPNLKKTSRTIFLLYNGFLAAGIILYLIFKMSFFDALCHAMSALSTAGFSTRADSIGAYNSVGIEVVTSVLMLVGSTNFAVLSLLLRGRIGRVLKVGEVRFMLIMTAGFALLIAVSMTLSGSPFFSSLHKAVFGVITTFSTTGYTLSDYYTWQPFAVFLLFILMFVGGGAGSTAGGMKILRIHILLKAAVGGIWRRLSPSNKIIHLKYSKVQGKSVIDADLISETMAFAASYIMIFIAGTALILLFNPDIDLFKGMFEFASALGTVGISNGLTKTANAPTLVVEMIGMILGRLEIFIVFVGIYAAARRIANIEIKPRRRVFKK